LYDSTAVTLLKLFQNKFVKYESGSDTSLNIAVKKLAESFDFPHSVRVALLAMTSVGWIVLMCKSLSP
jgi:hypothetical protein